MVLLLLFIFTVIIIGTFGVGYIKGYYHFKYLKRLYPDKYKDYESFHSAWHIVSYNREIALLILPWFRRDRIIEDLIAIDIAKKVSVYLYLNLCFYFLLLLLPVIDRYV